jgi:hypothetical protein
MRDINKSNLKSFIENEIIKEVKKVRGKHAPISEVVNQVSKSLKVENLYDLSNKNKYFFLLIAKNYNKQPKLRYFLAVSIANTSSDLLVHLARENAIKNDLRLIQYSIFPKTLRIQLLLLKEIEKIEEFAFFLKKLAEIRKDFRKKLIKITNLIENE